jgi:hypothetical protein
MNIYGHVPDESDAARTVGLRVQLAIDHLSWSRPDLRQGMHDGLAAV